MKNITIYTVSKRVMLQESQISNVTQIQLQGHTSMITRSVTRCQVYIHLSRMSAVVGVKSLVIFLSMGVQSGLTLGPLCCLFIGGL